MTTPTSISFDSISDTVLDYAFLKQKGMEYIESIASELWTDYNTHDPGITILEMLCYAITDLAARTQLPMEDLIAEAEEYSFFTAKEILPNKALTINDYRKILIDLPSVRDANVEPSMESEIAVYQNQIGGE